MVMVKRSAMHPLQFQFSLRFDHVTPDEPTRLREADQAISTIRGAGGNDGHQQPNMLPGQMTMPGFQVGRIGM